MPISIRHFSRRRRRRPFIHLFMFLNSFVLLWITVKLIFNDSSKLFNSFLSFHFPFQFLYTGLFLFVFFFGCRNRNFSTSNFAEKSQLCSWYNKNCQLLTKKIQHFPTWTVSFGFGNFFILIVQCIPSFRPILVWKSFSHRIKCDFKSIIIVKSVVCVCVFWYCLLCIRSYFCWSIYIWNWMAFTIFYSSLV